MRLAVGGLALTAVLAGCQTNTETGALLGAGAGAAVGNLLGAAVGGSNSRTIGTLVGAGAGALIGGQIGSMLDERDREKAAEASRQALERAETERRIELAERRAAEAERRASSAERQAATAQRQADAARREAARTQPAEDAAAPAERTAAPAPTPTRTTAPRGPRPQVSWNSENNPGVGGSSTVVSQPTENCYVVREIAVVPGRGEVAQDARYCREGQGWQRVA